MLFLRPTTQKCLKQVTRIAAATTSLGALQSQLWKSKVSWCMMTEHIFWRRLTIRDSLSPGKKTKLKPRRANTNCRLSGGRVLVSMWQQWKQMGYRIFWRKTAAEHTAIVWRLSARRARRMGLHSHMPKEVELTGNFDSMSRKSSLKTKVK